MDWNRQNSRNSYGREANSISDNWMNENDPLLQEMINEEPSFNSALDNSRHLCGPFSSRSRETPLPYQRSHVGDLSHSEEPLNSSFEPTRTPNNSRQGARMSPLEGPRGDQKREIDSLKQRIFDLEESHREQIRKSNEKFKELDLAVKQIKNSLISIQSSITQHFTEHMAIMDDWGKDFQLSAKKFMGSFAEEVKARISPATVSWKGDAEDPILSLVKN